VTDKREGDEAEEASTLYKNPRRPARRQGGTLHLCLIYLPRPSSVTSRGQLILPSQSSGVRFYPLAPNSNVPRRFLDTTQRQRTGVLRVVVLSTFGAVRRWGRHRCINPCRPSRRHWSTTRAHEHRRSPCRGDALGIRCGAGISPGRGVTELGVQ
jgi:hypothetical protein